jgi:glycosyltransferase involved in cell wall biosynthesis
MMSEKPLSLTIVIPAYNEERYLKACLESIKNQTVKPDDVILVNNNSTDKTVEIAESYKFVKVINEDKQGIVYARNTGFNAAKSDLIGRIDADTLLSQDWVELVKKYFDKNKKSAALTGSCKFYDFPFKAAFHAVHTFVYYILQRYIAGTNILWGSNMAIRNSVWKKIKTLTHNSNKIHEDIDLTLCLRRQKLYIERCPNIKAEVSLRRGNLGIGSLYKYLSRWHISYFKNGVYLRTLFIILLEIITLLSAILAIPFRRLINKVV